MPADFRFGGMIGPMVEPIEGPDGAQWRRRMGLGFGGGAPPAPRDLKGSINAVSRERASLQPYKDRALVNTLTQESRLGADLRRNTAMTLAKKDQVGPFATSFRGALAQATRRARARQGIVNRGDAAIKNQSLKDRIRVAQQHASRRGSLQNTLQTALNIKEGVNVGVSDANNRIRESNAQLFGTLAGTAARVGKNWYDNRTSTIDPIDTSSFPEYRGTPTYDLATGMPVYPGTGGP